MNLSTGETIFLFFFFFFFCLFFFLLNLEFAFVYVYLEAIVGIALMFASFVKLPLSHMVGSAEAKECASISLRGSAVRL